MADSGKMILHKQWIIRNYNIQDLEYVTGCGCRWEVFDTKATEIISQKQIYRYYGGGDRQLYIVTTNDDEESKVMLKFSGRMELIHMWHSGVMDRYEF
jgi:hypothetical protein